MSLITTQLGKRTADLRTAQAKAAMLSLESDIVDLADQANSDVAEVSEISSQITDASDDIVASTTGAESLSGLVDGTIAIYGEQGIPEDAAKQLEVSVEAILRVMGHPGGFSTVLPSFESCMSPAQYSAEAEEKKGSVVGRIWEWIKKIFGNLYDFLTGLVDKIRNTSANLKKLNEKIKQKVAGLKGETPAGTLTLGKDAAFVVDGNPFTSVELSADAFKEYVDKWEKYFGSIFSANLKPKNPEDASGFIDAVFTASDKIKELPIFEGAGDKIHITAFHEAVVTKGTDADYPTSGAKVKVEIYKPSTVKELKHLSVESMEKTIAATEKCLTEMDATVVNFEKWKANLTVLKKMGGSQKTAGTIGKVVAKGEGKASAADLQKRGIALQGLARLGIDGLQQSIPPLLTVIRANLNYVNKSANGYGKDDAKPAEPKAAEKTED